MSHTILLAAVKQTLKQHSNIDSSWLAVRATPNPPAYAGQERFIVLHPGQHQYGPSDDQIEGFDEYFGIQITLTRRVSSLPEDQQLTRGYLDPYQGLETLARRVIKTMHEHRYTILNFANTFVRDPIHQMATLEEYDPLAVGVTYDYSNPDGDSYFPPNSALDPYIILSSTDIQFIEPLRFAGASPIRQTPADWFLSTSTKPKATPPANDGLFITLTYTNCRRMQSIYEEGGIF